jgi:hypothetical protein
LAARVERALELARELGAFGAVILVGERPPDAEPRAVDDHDGHLLVRCLLEQSARRGGELLLGEHCLAQQAAARGGELLGPVHAQELVERQAALLVREERAGFDLEERHELAAPLGVVARVRLLGEVQHAAAWHGHGRHLAAPAQLAEVRREIAVVPRRRPHAAAHDHDVEAVVLAIRDHAHLHRLDLEAGGDHEQEREQDGQAARHRRHLGSVGA